MAQDLSLGGLLLAADALSTLPDDIAPGLQTRTDQALRLWEAERTSKGAAIEAKAGAEFPHRLNLWRAYLQDLAEKPNEAAAYATEVRHRVIIERLREIQGSRSTLAELDRLDATLRTWLVPGRFVWEDNLQSTYPPARFWYLYGRPSPPAPLPPSGRGGKG
ncbi:MAG: hypothetical protein HW375_218 [Anaerolineales bacterium]|nr:hypothetical protein [Anaerolineales bacterium]